MPEEPDIRSFETAAAGYAVLITWPEMRDGKHVHDLWYACFSEQLQAVRAVSGALNDAKVELLGSLSESALREHGVPSRGVKRADHSDITSPARH